MDAARINLLFEINGKEPGKMDQLRYPIGRFEGIQHSTAEQRKICMEEIRLCSKS